MVAQHLVYFSRSRSTVKEDLSMRSAVLSVVRITFIVSTLLPLFHPPVRKSFGSKLRNFPSPPELLLHPLVLLMAVAMSQIFRTLFHPSSSLFLTLTPTVSLAPVCSNISVTPLTLLLSLLSVCLRRQCVMPSLNLSLVSVMVPLFLPTILSMLKKFFVSIYLSCLLP